MNLGQKMIGWKRTKSSKGGFIKTCDWSRLQLKWIVSDSSAKAHIPQSCQSSPSVVTDDLHISPPFLVSVCSALLSPLFCCHHHCWPVSIFPCTSNLCLPFHHILLHSPVSFFCYSLSLQCFLSNLLLFSCHSLKCSPHVFSAPFLIATCIINTSLLTPHVKFHFCFFYNLFNLGCIESGSSPLTAMCLLI